VVSTQFVTSVTNHFPGLYLCFFHCNSIHLQLLPAASYNLIVIACTLIFIFRLI